MKTHDGRKLQVCAVILAVILALASIALGVIQIVVAADSRHFMEAGGVTGILTLIIGPLAAYVLCLALRGFGTIVRKYENDENEPDREQPAANHTVPAKLAQREKDREAREKDALSDWYAERFGTDKAGDEEEEEIPPETQKKRTFLNMIGIEDVGDNEDKPSKTQKKRMFLNMIGIEDVGDDEDNA